MTPANGNSPAAAAAARRPPTAWSWCVTWQDTGADLDQAGDEPLMLARQLDGVAVLAAGSRFLAGRLAETQFGCTVHLLDDGFQHFDLLAAPPISSSSRAKMSTARLRCRPVTCASRSTARRAQPTPSSRSTTPARLPGWPPMTRRRARRRPGARHHERTRLRGVGNRVAGIFLPPCAMAGGPWRASRRFAIATATRAPMSPPSPRARRAPPAQPG